MKDPGTPPAEKESACSILVVDDDDGIRELVSVVLTKKGHKVSSAANGAEALKLAAKARFHLAIIDFMMPGKNGIETMLELKKQDPNLESIIMTAVGSEKLAFEALSKGAYTYLIKPFDMIQLDALIPGVREKTTLKTLVGIYEATRRVFAAVALEDLLPNLVALANKILDADYTSLMLMGEDGELRIEAATGLEEEIWRKVRVRLGQGVAGRVAQWKTGVTISGPLQSDPRFADLPSRKDAGSSLIYPILQDNELLGILSANKPQGKEPFTAEDLRHAVVFCSQIGQAIQNAKLYEKLEKARKAAIDANEVKDELLYMTSHDLKSPLTAIQSYAALLLDKTLPDDARKNAVERIKRGVGTILTLVQQIMRKGQVEAAGFKLDKQPTLVGEVFDEYLKDFEQLAAMRKMRLVKENKVPSGFKATLDPTAFAEIVANLVSNAMKFTEPGGEIRVILEIGGGRLVLKVSDTGPGISEEEQKKIFLKFQRGVSVKAEGSGYGLAIVKRLAELHGGEAELARSSTAGSTFQVFLPPGA